MLEANHLVKRFFGVAAVDEVTFVVRPGEIVGYLGPNGSGKTMTARMLTGLLTPTSGIVSFNGRDIAADMVGYHRRLGYVPEEPHLYPFLSGREYLQLIGRLRELPATLVEKKIDAFLELFGIRDAAEQSISAYSKGMKQKVGIAQSLINTPDLLFLDEPMRGLDPAGVHDFRDILLEMNRNGATIVMNSHILAEVEAVATAVAVLHRARVVASGDVASLTRIDGNIYDVVFDCSELPPMVSDPKREENRWTATAAKESLSALLSFLQSANGNLVSCELKRMSLEDRFLSIVRQEREHA